jgi:hypothetical protein
MIQTGDKNNLYNVSLEIDKAGKDDGGEYKCIAKNSLGDSTRVPCCLPLSSP